MKTDSKIILSAAAVTANGFMLVNGRSTSGVSLIISILSAPTGTTPGIQFTLTAVDFSPSMLQVATPVSSAVLNTVGASVVYLPISRTGNIKVSWTVSGGSPNFGSISATLVDDASTLVSSTGVTLVDGSGFTQPISAVSLPLPTGAATAALQTQPGVDIGDVTVNNAAGAAGVNIQDGGNSITVDSTQLPAALVGGRLDENVGSWLGSTAPTVGSKTSAQSIPVVMATDQPPISVTFNAASSRSGVSVSVKALGGSTAGTLQIMEATAYVEPASGVQRSIGSSSASDAAAGVGARTVRITYYDNTGVGPLFETVTLNGTTPVNTVATNIRFVEKLEVLTAGTSLVNVGTISLFGSTAGAGGTVGTIGIGNIVTGVGDNVTLWAHHYIAAGYTAELAVLVVSAQSGGSGTSAKFFAKSKSPLVANSAEVLVGDVLLIQGSFERQFDFHPNLNGFARVTVYEIVTP